MLQCDIMIELWVLYVPATSYSCNILNSNHSNVDFWLLQYFLFIHKMSNIISASNVVLFIISADLTCPLCINE